MYGLVWLRGKNKTLTSPARATPDSWPRSGPIFMQPVMQGFDYAAQRNMYRPGTGCMRMWHCKERDGLFASANEVYYGIVYPN